MTDLFRLVLAMAEGGVVRRARRAIRRAGLLAAFGAAAIFCLIGSLAFALVALWIYLAPQVGAVVAPLILAGILLLLCLVLLAAMRFGRKSVPISHQADDASALLLAEVTKLLKEHKGSVLAAALLAGLVAGQTGR